MSEFRLTETQLNQYHRDGFVIVRELFHRREIDALLQKAKGDSSLEESALHRRDGEGGITKLRVWNELSDDLFGLFARSARIVNPMEQILDGEVYFYHSKMMLKDPLTGGAWAWHQDYGYWYNNGCLFPNMASCLIAVDRNTKENGCLQVLTGSHRLGRIDHIKVGDQTGADPERVEQARKVFPLVYVEKEPGDALFFHCNLLHRSDQNKSPNSRWSYICCYNSASNNPYKVHHHPQYHRLEKVDASVLA